MKKKYELVKDDYIKFLGKKLYRIRALIDFSDVKKGDTGGYVESENNLSQTGFSWIYDEAKVRGNAVVRGDAKVRGDAEVRGNVKVVGNAIISGNALVFGDAKVCRNARIMRTTDYITISPIGSEHGTLTAYKTKDGEIGCSRGCFRGTLDEFEKAIEKTHRNTFYEKQYGLAIQLVKLTLQKE